MIAAIPLSFVSFVTAGLGLIIGSFLNVVVYRVPAGLSVSTPASACPNCHSAIRAVDNIPVVSWFALRGKCRDCRTPISARYPLVEAATAAFFLVVALRFWPVGEPSDVAHLASRSLILVAFLYLAAVSVALAIIDTEHRRLPNRIVLPSYLVGAALLSAAAVLTGDWSTLLRAGLGMSALVAFYFTAAFVYPAGMGLGDVKLAGVIGLYLGFLGWGPLVVGAFAAFLLGGVFSLVLLAVGRLSRKGGIPFGPWMLLGAWAGILLGQTVWSAYLSLYGLT